MYSGIRGRRGRRRRDRTRKGRCLVERLELRRLLSAPVVNWIQGAGYSAGGFTPTDLAVGKFNADNFPDLVVGGNNQARILAGDGRGGFTLASTNPYFPMDVGRQLVLTGEDNGESIRLEVNVLDQTRTIAGVTTRVVEEREEVDGVEVGAGRGAGQVAADLRDVEPVLLAVNRGIDAGRVFLDRSK